MSNWYETISGPDLEQGDLLMKCPVPQVEAIEIPLPETIGVVVDERDLVVLSQTCDLVNDKIGEVILAAVRDYRSLVSQEGERNSFLKSSRWRRAAADGMVVNMSLIPPAEGLVVIDWSLVDFHHLFTLPKAYVRGFANTTGQRLRILPPYREHLAQAFARYFMRVGLPYPLVDFEQVKV